MGDYFERTEVAELISKNPGRSNRQDLEGFPDELGDDGGHPISSTLYPRAISGVRRINEPRREILNKLLLNQIN